MRRTIQSNQPRKLQFVKKTLADTDARRQVKFRSTNCHVRIWSSVSGNQSADIVIKDPIEPGIGLFDEDNFTAQRASVRCFRMLQINNFRFNPPVADKIWQCFGNKKGIKILRLRNQRRQFDTLSDKVVLFALRNNRL